MKFEKQKMVDWYNVRQLSSTALRTVISTLFGNYADRREMQSALMQQDEFDYSVVKNYKTGITEREEIWVDYIADLGDGFDSTYTMAHLLAMDELETDHGKIRRGNLLVMGGDQVYPTPVRQEYRNRLQGPYNAALPWTKTSDNDLPHLYALPGNHDWYDGLGNFLKLFCQRRSLGNWCTKQSRSYFALKLPQGYWIWGIDVQLSSDIDKPQLDYFTKISARMLKGAKVILCTAEPAWVFRSINEKDKSYERLEFFIREFIRKNEFEHVATLTGDMHHYSHYVEREYRGTQGLRLITAGGGGAFMHPTHFLKDKIEVDRSVVENNVQKDGKCSFDLAAVYPPKNESRKLAFGNILFPFTNWVLPATLGVYYLIVAWFLQSVTIYKGDGKSFMEEISRLDLTFGHSIDIAGMIYRILAHSPSVIILNIILVAGLVGFADPVFGRPKLNKIAGLVHGFIQLMVMYFLIWRFSWINLEKRHMELDHPLQFMLFSVEMIVVGGLVSGFIFGIYLIITTLVLNAHPTEAYSSLRGTGYKNFLRIHISKKGATVYPIGVKKVVTNWKNTATVDREEKPQFSGDKIAYELIEPPFKLK